MTNVREQHIKNRICFDNYFASYLTVSSGPKKSNTNFFKKKKGNLPGDKILWPNFFLILSSFTNLREQLIRPHKVL